ncbi:hypothetical protein [Leisingera sp. McT4-56]|uniref:hypothetical protein n=1 Tax=Leisingera sp. McT4-56 TaxID=2881255 RepID=UPI001CF8DF5E|nr:hypothetical protein [Leisingera sp. McT4-56]MCB4455900.1 hypothetical protein [Leisingera sp. McT4-56]
MNAAIGSALSSMDAFLSHVLDSQGNAADGALVKVALETSYGHEKHLGGPIHRCQRRRHDRQAGE